MISDARHAAAHTFDFWANAPTDDSDHKRAGYINACAGRGSPPDIPVARCGVQFLEGLIGAGVPAGTAELLVTREWAILAGENDYATDTFQQITGRSPRPVAEFLHEYRTEFV